MEQSTKNVFKFILEKLDDTLEVLVAGVLGGLATYLIIISDFNIVLRWVVGIIVLMAIVRVVLKIWLK